MTTRPQLTMTITGYVARDPELRFTGSGKAVANITVPYTPRRRNPQTGEWEDAGETTWVEAAVWGDDAETVCDTLHKGSLVTLTGRPSVDVYTNRNGQAVPKLRMAVDSWAIHPRRPQAQAGQPTGGYTRASQPAAPAGGQDGDPWATSGGSSFGDQPPF
ncbi:single-stranded DNA-binding protein [Actinomyces urogenitalis]|uniref:single-stranded DNA-binding protein n=1 Tax=Actinomyces urogenitalis TaxID=103621 RepID=UPI0029024B9F|nr:single-stranded DNA-binding protein [Actinomyces urogenitalis]MDU0864437.1 single-stranded DNA-binding protein [Actinomyces urogenitalis]MDU0874983.1 single-stranded DNA-binding protein [Actinomyces urogenitalis]MDU1565346.1 single-stranded DNA-binding protein [Actinomyces urogenitalis]MDU1640589.1 single-stranded DNA-binding protein [Actinomyces urogenitalis]MDU6777763.1 single-stranded DNA-binding protein [Actinomyces urogenitalis]